MRLRFAQLKARKKSADWQVASAGPCASVRGAGERACAQRSLHGTLAQDPRSVVAGVRVHKRPIILHTVLHAPPKPPSVPAPVAFTTGCTVASAVGVAPDRASFLQRHESAATGGWQAASIMPTKDRALASGVRASGAAGDPSPVATPGCVVVATVPQSQNSPAAQSASAVQAAPTLGVTSAAVCMFASTQKSTRARTPCKEACPMAQASKAGKCVLVVPGGNAGSAPLAARHDGVCM